MQSKRCSGDCVGRLAIRWRLAKRLYNIRELLFFAKKA